MLNVYKCIAPSKSFGTWGISADAPSTTLKLPSLSKNILSILGK